MARGMEIFGSSGYHSRQRHYSFGGIYQITKTVQDFIVAIMGILAAIGMLIMVTMAQQTV